MRYADGSTPEAGDLVQIDGLYRGRVVANMEVGDYLPGHEAWAYLEKGVMVDTDFGGLVHYVDESADQFVLLRRAGKGTPG